MCSINEDGLILMESSQPALPADNTCKKCLQEKTAEVVLRKKDLYCVKCFLINATHKFRAALGRSKIIKQGDKILVAFSGSPSSLAMVHLINTGLTMDTHKKLIFQPYLVYVDEGAFLGLPFDKRQEMLKDVTNVLKDINIPAYSTSIEILFRDTSNDKIYPIDSSVSYSKCSELEQIISGFKCPTAKQDFLKKLRQRTLLEVAATLGCCKILTAETLVDTATNILSNISLGRGAQLPFDVGFCDNRYTNIKVLRPMQEFGSDEIEFYLHFHKLNPVNSIKDVKSTNSIQSLTRKFVTNLQENFASTVSTVYRTGAKLSVGNEDSDTSERCSICQGPLDTALIESSSLQATQFSSYVSNSGPSGRISNGNIKNDISPEETTCDGKKCKCRSDKLPSKEEMNHSLCYGCRLIIKEIDSVEHLPKFVKDSAESSNKFRQMREEIEEFLL